MRRVPLAFLFMVALQGCGFDTSGLRSPAEDGGQLTDRPVIADRGGAPDRALPTDASSPLDRNRPADLTPPTDRTLPPIDIAIQMDAPPQPDLSASDAPPIDAIPPCKLWTARHFDACAIPAPGGNLELTSGAYTYDTTAGKLTDNTGQLIAHVSTMIDQGGMPARLVSAARFAVDQPATLQVIGPMPLVVASWSVIVVDGKIDVGSHLGAPGGAGANPGVCGATAAGIGDNGNSGTGGGGGGGFSGNGGKGGVGDNDHTVRNGGRGGLAVGAPTVVRGGCPGANSGTNTDPASVAGFGAGGTGGGALQLTAFTSISVTGSISAGGSGGAGGPDDTAAGGGGGGSGGYIGLDSAQVGVSGILAANGGGGGEGPPFAQAGKPGEDGHPDATPAAGAATGTACAGDGANGSAGSVLNGADVTDADVCGGGGGGGAAGFILVFSPAFTMSTVSSPLVTMPPP